MKFIQIVLLAVAMTGITLGSAYEAAWLFEKSLIEQREADLVREMDRYIAQHCTRCTKPMNCLGDAQAD